MKRIHLFISILVCLYLTHPVMAQISVSARVDTSESIYVGKRFSYSIVIEGHNEPGEADLSPLSAYHPQSTGNQDVSQTSYTIINGRSRTSVVKRFVMGYSLVVDKPGDITLPPVTVTIDGQTYRTNPVPLTVLKPGTTDKLDLVVELSDTSCYVGQAVVMTVRLYVLDDVDVGGLDVSVPAFDTDRFVLEDPEVTDPQAKAYRLSSGVPVQVSQRRVTHKGRRAIEVSFGKILIPQQRGTLPLGETAVTASLAVGRSRSRDPFEGFGFFGSRKQYAQFRVTAPSKDLVVRPLPRENRPAGFNGLVGRYTIDAQATPTRVDVGQPITLTIEIGGSPYLKPVQWPELEAIPEMAANFKIPQEKAAPVRKDGAKVFTQTLRANSDGVTHIPSIPLVYFDPDRGDYVEAKTDPIALEVAPTKVLTNIDMEGRSSQPVNRRIQAVKQGIAANYTDRDALVNQQFTLLGSALSPTLLPIWALPLLGLIAGALVKMCQYRDPVKMARKRRQQAAPHALREIKRCAACDNSRRPALLGPALKQFIGERFDKPFGSLTADDCYRILCEHMPDDTLALQFKTILDACEACQYAAQQTDINEQTLDQAATLIQKIHKQIKT